MELLNVEVDKWEIPLGQISLEEIIGSGAFGTVWRATLSRGNGKRGIRFVAAKCFSRKYGSALLIDKERLRGFNIFSSHGLLPSDLVAQSVERRRSNPKVVGSIPTLVRVFLCPCVGPVPSVGLTLTWFIWDRNLALHVTLHSIQLTLFKNISATRPTFV